MRSKRIIALFLSALMLMPLTACSKNKKVVQEASEELGEYVISFNARKISKMYDDIDEDDESTYGTFESRFSEEVVEAVFAGAEYSVEDIDAGKADGTSVIVISVKDFTTLDPDDYEDMNDFIDAIDDIDDTVDYSFEVEWIIDDGEAVIDDCELISCLEDLFEDLDDVTPSFVSNMVERINFWNDSDEEGIYTSNPSWIDLDVSMSDDFGYQDIYFTVSDDSGVIYTSDTVNENDYIECYWYADSMNWSEIPSGTYTFKVYTASNNSLICAAIATVR